ncbi:MAG: response regulator transcription factor [Flavobacteriales bacterium]|nr:response regulator transcription factor [Flavobacteriales bacterium]
MDDTIEIESLGKDSHVAKQTILLVDDEPDILEFIGFNLMQAGYDVRSANNGREGLELALEIKPDLILLDVMMPEMDGIEACIHIRKEPSLSHCLVAFLTARGEDYSQVAGFDSGADDYILKSIKPRVLTSRIKALLRRVKLVSSELQTGEHNGISIDRERYLVIQNGKKINLPKKEFELLSLLWSQPGKVFNRDKILTSVWGNDVIVGDRTIDVHVRKLRSKFGANCIETVKGVGYKFES